MNDDKKRTLHGVITIISYKDAQLSSVYGLKDLFSIAKITCSQSISSQNEMFIVQICDSNNLPSLDTSVRNIVIIPPSLEGIPSPQEHLALLQNLRSWHEQGVIITSVCAGAFLLAEAGLLDHLQATTHWAYAEKLRHDFPQITVKTHKLLIDNGHIITAGGLMAWIDLGLYIVGLMFGKAIMTKTAHFMLVKAPRPQQSPYIDFQLHCSHTDSAILKAQEWLETQHVPSVTVIQFSHASGLAQRTFLRRFKHATGMQPKEYLLHHIISRARQELETTSKTIDQIAWEAGYRETGSFRRSFKKITGLSPTLYKRG